MTNTACISDSMEWKRLSSKEIGKLNTYQFMEYLGKKVINPGGSLGLEKILDRLDIQPGSRVLDIGCGTGHAACMIARKYGCHVTAIDISGRAIVAANRLVKRRKMQDKVHCETGNINELNFSDRTFDYVICQAVIMFVEHEVAFAEIARVLKPGGKYGGLEFSWKIQPPSDVAQETYTICGCATLKFYDSKQWHERLQHSLENQAAVTEHNFDLLSVRGFLRDEGIFNSIKIGSKLLRKPAAIKRMAQIWNHFSDHSEFFSYVVLSGHKHDSH
jgi:SAM-dependent methyltransferase